MRKYGRLSISASDLFSLSAKSGCSCHSPSPLHTHTLPPALPLIWNFYICILADKISQILFIHSLSIVLHKMTQSNSYTYIPQNDKGWLQKQQNGFWKQWPNYFFRWKTIYLPKWKLREFERSRFLLQVSNINIFFLFKGG